MSVSGTGPSFGKPKAKVIVSAQRKSSPVAGKKVNSVLPENEVPTTTWTSRNTDGTKTSQDDSKKPSLTSFAPVSASNSSSVNSELDTTKSGLPVPPTRDSSLPRRSNVNYPMENTATSVPTTLAANTRFVAGTSSNGRPLSSTTTSSASFSKATAIPICSVSTAAVKVGACSVSQSSSNSAFSTSSTGLPRYPVFIKSKESSTHAPLLSRPLSLCAVASSDNTVLPCSGMNGSAANEETKPRSQSMSSTDSSRVSVSRPTNLHNMSFNSLNRSTGSVASGLSVLSASNTNLNKSSLSLYKSSESLTSTSSNHAEKTRAAKLAFLNVAGGGDSNSKGNNSQSPSVDPFARYKVSGRKSSTGSSNTSKSTTSNGHPENTNHSTSESSENSTPTHNLRQSPSQGRFVASKIEQLQRKSVDISPPSPESPSSGLGSSICSPLSPVKSSAGSTIDFTSLNGHQMAVNNNTTVWYLKRSKLKTRYLDHINFDVCKLWLVCYIHICFGKRKFN